jgi:hypothetical protein
VTDKERDEQSSGCTHRQTNEQEEKQTGILNVQITAQLPMRMTDKQMDIQTDEQSGGWTGRQTDEQEDRPTDINSVQITG